MPAAAAVKFDVSQNHAHVRRWHLNDDASIRVNDTSGAKPDRIAPCACYIRRHQPGAGFSSTTRTRLVMLVFPVLGPMPRHHVVGWAYNEFRSCRSDGRRQHWILSIRTDVYPEFHAVHFKYVRLDSRHEC